MSQTALEWCCLRPSPRGAARLFGWPLALDMIGDNVRSRIVSVCLCLIVLVYYFYTSVLLLDSDNDLRNHAGFTSTVDSFTTTNVNQSSISTTTNDITSTSTTTDTAATPSTADITWLTPAQFGALALYVLTCSIGNAASQHPVIGLVGVGSTAVVAWVLWPLLSQLAHPSCPPEPMPTGLDDDSMPVSACDVYQSLRFFFALILSSLFATVALMLLFNSIKCIFVDRGLSKRERFYLQYTSDLLRRRGIHAPRNPLAEPDQPQQPEPDQQPEQEPEKQFDNDSPLISFDDVDMPPPDDDDTSLDQVQRRVPLANTSDERRMRALANADSDDAEELPACARVKAELKQTACGAAAFVHVTSFRQSWVREMCNVNDARIIYPIRILVAFSLSMLAFGAVIWFLVIAFDAFALLLNYLSKYAQSNGTRFVLEVIRDVVHYATYGGAVLIALALLVVWLLTLKTYRLLQLDMRRGIYKYPTPLLTNVTLFLGYSVVLQCSLVAVIVVFAIIAGVCIAIPIFYPDSVGCVVSDVAQDDGGELRGVLSGALGDIDLPAARSLPTTGQLQVLGADRGRASDRCDCGRSFHCGDAHRLRARVCIHFAGAHGCHDDARGLRVVGSRIHELLRRDCCRSSPQLSRDARVPLAGQRTASPANALEAGNARVGRVLAAAQSRANASTWIASVGQSKRRCEIAGGCTLR
jgi:hypothetical protein